MRARFWHDRWRTGQIGFHRTSVDETLIRHWDALGAAPGTRVFVPMCGKSLDLAWLHRHGHQVVGVEISDIAVQAYLAENGVPARRRREGVFDVYEAPRTTIFRGDLFALTPELLGDVAAVYDRAALIAWHPDQRAAYVEKLTALTRPGTRTLLITLEYRQSEFEGPPFSVDPLAVRSLYGAGHRIEELARRDILDEEPRLRARGLTALAEVVYRLTRL